MNEDTKFTIGMWLSLAVFMAGGIGMVFVIGGLTGISAVLLGAIFGLIGWFFFVVMVCLSQF